MKYVDLHLHTNFSDGTYTPQELCYQAKEQGFSAISITDHDSIGALGIAKKLCTQINLEFIPGVELTAEQDNFEIHMLGYFIDWQKPWLVEKLKEICAVRTERIYQIVDKLKKLGVQLDVQEILNSGGKEAAGRLHVARMLKSKGYVTTIQEAFDRYLGNQAPGFVRKFKLTPRESIKMILNLKGVPVLAHPFSVSNEDLIYELIEHGLRGIEVYHPDQNSYITQKLKELALKNNLLVTGGSDCHGLAKEQLMLGKVKLPYEYLETLKEEAQRIKNA